MENVADPQLIVNSTDTIIPDGAFNSTPLDQISTTIETAAATGLSATEQVAVAAEIAATAISTDLTSWWLQPALLLINSTHDMTGLPWYLAIAASTVAVRALLLPITLFTMRNSAKMQAIQPDIAAIREGIMEAARSGNQPLAKQRQDEMQNFMRGAGVSPLNVLMGPLIQFPVFISFFVGIRRMSAAEPSFSTGGISWFTDLSLADPTYLLPIICGASLLGMSELGGDTGSTKMTPQMRMGMRCIAALSVPMTYWFPAAIFCYWLPNNLFSMGLGAIMRNETSRKSLGLNVDAADIVGTKAAREKEQLARMADFTKNVGGAKQVDVAAAVAGYIRKEQGGDMNVKPVLLKRRPKRKKKM